MRLNNFKARKLLSKHLRLPCSTWGISYIEYVNLPQVQAFLGINRRIVSRPQATKLIRNAVLKNLPGHLGNNRKDSSSVNTAKSCSNQDITAFYESWEWKRVRYDFIKSKDRKCECCGTTPEDGVRIVVDHIKPIRRYWDLRLDISNLQLLCNDCNMGKGSHDETDWRSQVIEFPDEELRQRLAAAREQLKIRE